MRVLSKISEEPVGKRARDILSAWADASTTGDTCRSVDGRDAVPREERAPDHVGVYRLSYRLILGSFHRKGYRVGFGTARRFEECYFPKELYRRSDSPRVAQEAQSNVGDEEAIGAT